MEDILVLETTPPESILPFPDSFGDRAKFVFWKALSPFFSMGQKALIAIGILRHQGRQNYVIGRLAKGRTLTEFLVYLDSQEYRNHFIAWEDEGQLVSLRKLESFERQYHLRVFNDGEIRGHYEFTPEAHPIWHLKEIGLEDRREVFLNVVRDWLQE